eukprot:6704566-Pyramimonas_sp.AAC.1
MGITGMPALAAADTRMAPGSLTIGIPASLTTTSRSPVGRHHVTKCHGAALVRSEVVEARRAQWWVNEVLMHYISHEMYQSDG